MEKSWRSHTHQTMPGRCSTSVCVCVCVFLLHCVLVSFHTRLNGTTHNVYTGVTLAWWAGSTGGDMNTHSFYEGTEVTFSRHSDDIIESYIESGEPL